jgi:hypothetical protein
MADADKRRDGGSVAPQAWENLGSPGSRPQTGHPKRIGSDGEVVDDWFWWRGAWRPM